MTEERLKGKEREEELSAGVMNNTRLGTLIFLSAEAMLFAGFLGAYVVLRSGADVSSVPPDGISGEWILFGIGAGALLTLEFARRNAPGTMGAITPRIRHAVFLYGGAGLALLAAAGRLVTASDTILGWGGGSFRDPAALSPVQGCRLFLHTLLALHVLVTLLLTGVGVRGMVRSAGNVAEYLLRAELLWGFAVGVQLAFAGIGV